MGEATQLDRDPEHSEGSIGRYQLCFALASGGMAKLYLARVTGPGGFDKLVALKCIHAHLADQEDFVEMFLDEARIASRINHPNVCTVFDFGMVEETYYIAMEYLLGDTAARLANKAAKDPALRASTRWQGIVARIVAEACEGLHAAHEVRGDRGEELHVVHRDVSPHNLFVGYDGSVKVMDFGIAHATGRVHQTEVGTIKGRYAYMAPEQARGESLDRRADVWSLGVVLWEMLVFERLFRRDNAAETIMAVVYDPVPRLRDRSAHIDPGLEDIVGRALARNPAERYQSAREMGRDLNRFLLTQDEPIGKPELAELMESLFSSQRELRQEMIEEARTMQGPVRQGRGEDDSSSVRLQALFAKGAHPPSGAGAESRGDATTVGKRAPRRLLPVLMVILGLVGGLTLTVVVGSMLLKNREPPGSIASEPPAEPEPRAGGSAEGPDEAAAAVAPAPAAEAAAAAEPEAEAGTEGEAEGEEQSVAEGTPEAEEETNAAGEVETEGDEEAEAEGKEGARGGAAAEDDANDAEARAKEARAERRARRRRARRAAAAGPPGTVAVVTPGGWADVYFRGRKVGRSPGRVQIPSGRQTLEIRPFGKTPGKRTPVNVPAGGTARVSVRVSR